MANYTICQLEFTGLLDGCFPPTGGSRFSLNLFFRFSSKKDTAAIANTN